MPTPSGMTIWPSGLRRWPQAPFRKGVGSNPTAVKCRNILRVDRQMETQSATWRESAETYLPLLRVSREIYAHVRCCL